MEIIIITHHNFGSKPGGASNRILELAKALSRHARVKIIHQGSSMSVENVTFVGYKTVVPIGNWISGAMTPYVSFAFPDFYRVVKETVGNADIIQVEQPYLMIPTLMATIAMNKKSLLVLDEHNVDFLAIKSKIDRVSLPSLLTIATLPYVFLSESLAVRYAQIILCVSYTDRESFIRHYGVSENRLLVIPNGVNLQKFENAPSEDDPIREKTARAHTIFFHGTFSWHPNLEAANIIIDYLAPRIPEATFLIAGANAPASLVRKVTKAENVEYLGFVKNLEGRIKSSDVCIAPILCGGGTKLKILEYMAAGRPIVATYNAAEGLPLLDRVHALLFREVRQDFVDAIRALMADGDLAERLGSNARQLAVDFDWKEIGNKLYHEYGILVDRGR